MNIDVTQTSPQQITVTNPAGITVTTQTVAQALSVGNFVPKQTTFIGPSAPGVPGPWVWWQTGLGTGGTDFTLWLEDGLP